MKVELEVPQYSPSEGLQLKWEQGFTIRVHAKGEQVVIGANRAGLVSLARHLLELAQSQVPDGYHFHLDSSNALEDDSLELVIEKER